MEVETIWRIQRRDVELIMGDHLGRQPTEIEVDSACEELRHGFAPSGWSDEVVSFLKSRGLMPEE